MVSTLIAIFGDVGSGKSTILTGLAEDCYARHFDVIANYHEKHAKKFCLSDFVHNRYKRSFVAVDEAYLLMDSRNSSDMMNKLISYAAFQSRKGHNCYAFAMQELKTIDIRVRDLIHLFILCELKFDDSGFFFTFFTKKHILCKKFLSKEKAFRIFQYFDSYEIISNEDMDFGKIETKSERKERIKKLSLVIPELAIKQKERLTKSFIRRYLFDKDMPKNDYIDIFIVN